MSTEKIMNLRERQSQLLVDAREKIDSIGDNTSAEQADAIEAEYDALMSEYDRLTGAIERMEKLDEIEDRRNQPVTPIPILPDTKGGIGDSDSAEWRDQNGATVRVLAPGDRLSDQHQIRSGARFGDIVKGLVTGGHTAEVRAVLAEGTNSLGGFTVPTPLSSELIDLMRAKSVCISCGARTIAMTSESLAIAKLLSDPIAAWRLENAAIASSDITFGQVTFVARSLAVLVKASRELLEDSLNSREALSHAFAQAMALEVDRVCLVGSGSAPEPRGVVNTVGISSVSMGTNGAAITDYAPMLDALEDLETSNSAAPTATIWHPRTSRAVNGLTDSTGQPLMPPKALDGVPRMTSTQVPIDDTQGTATDASKAIMGDFRQLFLGIRNDLRIDVLRERFADNHQVGFVAHLRMDTAIAQPSAFSVIEGITP